MSREAVEHRFNHVAAAMLSGFGGIVCALIVHMLSVGVSTGLRMLVVATRPENSFTQVRPFFNVLWLSISALVTCSFFAAICVKLRWSTVRTLFLTLSAVALLAVFVPLVGVAMKDQYTDELVGWYLLLSLLASSILFWLHLRPSPRHKPGFEVILAPTAKSPD